MFHLLSRWIIYDDDCRTGRDCYSVSLSYLIPDSLHIRAQVNVTLFTRTGTNAERPLLPLFCILMKLMDLLLPVEALCTFCMK